MRSTISAGRLERMRYAACCGFEKVYRNRESCEPICADATRITRFEQLLGARRKRAAFALITATVTQELISVSGYVRSILAPEQIRLTLGDQLKFASGSGGEYHFTFTNIRLTPGPTP